MFTSVLWTYLDQMKRNNWEIQFSHGRWNRGFYNHQFLYKTRLHDRYDDTYPVDKVRSQRNRYDFDKTVTHLCIVHESFYRSHTIGFRNRYFHYYYSKFFFNNLSSFKLFMDWMFQFVHKVMYKSRKWYDDYTNTLRYSSSMSTLLRFWTGSLKVSCV